MPHRNCALLIQHWRGVHFADGSAPGAELNAYCRTETLMCVNSDSARRQNRPIVRCRSVPMRMGGHCGRMATSKQRGTFVWARQFRPNQTAGCLLTKEKIISAVVRSTSRRFHQTTCLSCGKRSCSHHSMMRHQGGSCAGGVAQE